MTFHAVTFPVMQDKTSKLSSVSKARPLCVATCMARLDHKHGMANVNSLSESDVKNSPTQCSAGI